MKTTKKTVRETVAPKGKLAFLIESELEKAEVVLATKGILEKLQKMATDLAKVEADDIMPMLDSMRLTFGPDLTDQFNDATTAAIRQTTEAIKNAKDAITKQVARLENSVNGEETNDMGMDDTGDADLGDMGGLGDDLGGEDDLDMGGDAEADLGDAMGGEEVPPAPEGDMPGDDAGLDAAFDDAASKSTAAGRAKKESVQRNVKALSESKNPDRLIFETFRRTLKEAKGQAARAARAVAEAFDIDLNDVIEIVKENAVREGKTFKDEKGRGNKNDKFKDRDEKRATKKRERADEAEEVEEGKTFKDEKGKTSKNKDRSEDRAAKARDNKKPWEKDEIEEGKTFKDEKGKSDKNKDRSADRDRKKRERDTDED